MTTIAFAFVTIGIIGGWIAGLLQTFIVEKRLTLVIASMKNMFVVSTIMFLFAVIVFLFFVIDRGAALHRAIRLWYNGSLDLFYLLIWTPATLSGAIICCLGMCSTIVLYLSGTQSAERGQYQNYIIVQCIYVITWLVLVSVVIREATAF